MIYIIHAFENIYEGMYGIEDWAVIDEDDYMKVCLYATDLSYNLIEIYSYVFDSLKDKNGEFIEKLVEQDINYDIFALKDNTAFLIEVIREKLEDDPEWFVNKYCE